MSYLDFYTSARRSDTFSTQPEHDPVPYALAEVNSSELTVAARTVEEASARAAVEAAEATVRATKATDYVARELAIAPLHKLVKLREQAEQVAEDARQVLASRQLGLVSAIAQRRQEIAGKREKLAEMAAELDRQDGELKVLEGRHLAVQPEGQA